MSEKKFIVHGSKQKELSVLTPPPFAGLGANGAQHGVGVYSYPLEEVRLSMSYAEEGGSVYLAEIDISNYLRVDRDTHLPHHLKEALFTKVNTTDDVVIRARLATDLAGREERLFNSESDADAFYEARMSEAESWGLPDRYHPEFENDKGGYIVVSCSREELDDPEDIDANTSDIHLSLNTISSTFSSEVWSELVDGLIVQDLSGVDFYVSFYEVKVIKEFGVQVGADAITKEAMALGSAANQILDYDLSSNNSLLYVGKDGKVSKNISEVGEVEGELYIEPRPRPKIFFEHISGEHSVVPIVIATLYRSYPDWADADVRFDNNPKITLAEMHTSLADKVEGNQCLKLYHGTSSELLPRIAEEGIKCRDSSGVNAHYFNSTTKESLPDRTYFASEFGLGSANAAARSATSMYGGFPVILQFDVKADLLTNLMPDEDSQKNNFEDSLAAIGTCSFNGNVSPDYLAIASSRINHQIDGMKLEYANQAFEESRVVVTQDLGGQNQAIKVSTGCKFRI